MTVPRDPKSRTRPGKQPDPTVAALRALLRSTDVYIAALESTLLVMTSEIIEGRPELAYVRAALTVAAGKRGSGNFGTPVHVRAMLSRALGEEEQP